MAKACDRWSSIIGTVVALFGVALSYNLLVDPSARIAGHNLDGFMFFGPVILVVGLLLIRQRELSARSSKRNRISTRGLLLLTIGIALCAVPTFQFAYLAIAPSGEGEEGTGMLFTMSLFLCGLPGLALVCDGALCWRPRFSLRTLIIATTLAAVGLGLIVWLR